jgi:hypothetical protein
MVHPLLKKETGGKQMKENFVMRVFSVLLAMMLVSMVIVPAMACKPLEPGTCPGCSFIESNGVADDSNTLVSRQHSKVG